MQHIANTILKEAEELAQLHDFLKFKAQAHEEVHPQLSTSLAKCATLVAEASDLLVANVKYELAHHHAPMVSKIKKVSLPEGDCVECLNQALGLFPKESVPAVEIILSKTPERIASIQKRIVHYMQNKVTDIEALSRQKDAMEFYLAGTKRADT